MSDCGVFLDRDGTINQEVAYLSDVAQLALIDGAARGVQLLNEAGLKVIVVTNQAAVARGFLTEQTLESIHCALQDELRAQHAAIDAIYYCPHHPTEGAPPYRCDCDCRKPNSGMLQKAAKEWGLNLHKSFVVGDKISDLQAGQRVGCKSILVRTGYGREMEQSLDSEQVQPDFVAANLLEASEWILEQRLQS